MPRRPASILEFANSITQFVEEPQISTRAQAFDGDAERQKLFDCLLMHLALSIAWLRYSVPFVLIQHSDC